MTQKVLYGGHGVSLVREKKRKDVGKKKSMAFMSSPCKGQGTLRKRGQGVCKSQKTG